MENMLFGKKIGVTIPAYNEEAHILRTLDHVPNWVDYIVVVDDCSSDKTPDLLKTIKNEKIIIYRNQKNQGVGGSIIRGHYILFHKKKVDIAVVMAGDDQMDPKYLPKLIGAIIKYNADYAKGNRLLNLRELKKMPTHRVIGNYLVSFLNNVASGDWRFSDVENGYSAITKSAFYDLNLSNLLKRYQFENSLLIELERLGKKIIEIEIQPRYNDETSHIRLSQYIPEKIRFLSKVFLNRLKSMLKQPTQWPLLFLWILSLSFLNFWLLSPLFFHFLLINPFFKSLFLKKIFAFSWLLIVSPIIFEFIKSNTLKK